MISCLSQIDSHIALGDLLAQHRFLMNCSLQGTLRDQGDGWDIEFAGVPPLLSKKYPTPKFNSENPCKMVVGRPSGFLLGIPVTFQGLCMLNFRRE